MKIGVIGLWHLGAVYSACLAHLGNDVIAFDLNRTVVETMKRSQTPLFEAGLQEMLHQAIENKKIEFSSNLSQINECEVVWVTLDTPVNDDDSADVDSVLKLVYEILPLMSLNSLLIVSSQLPAGTMKKIESEITSSSLDIRIAVVPENLRLGTAIESFFNQDTWVLGFNGEMETFTQFCRVLCLEEESVLCMSPASAEMTKHAINTFLALSVSFANEIGLIASAIGADPQSVMEAVKSDPRIGKKAYLRPGKPIEGGTLLRDVNYLDDLSPIPKNDSIISTLKLSNSSHMGYILRKVLSALELAKARRVGITGIGYKSGSNTYRRSFAIDLGNSLTKMNYEVIFQDDYLTNTEQKSFEFGTCVGSLPELIEEVSVLVWNRHEPYNFQEVLLKFPDLIVVDLSNPFAHFEI